MTTTISNDNNPSYKGGSPYRQRDEGALRRWRLTNICIRIYLYLSLYNIYIYIYTHIHLYIYIYIYIIHMITGLLEAGPNGSLVNGFLRWHQFDSRTLSRETLNRWTGRNDTA